MEDPAEQLIRRALARRPLPRRRPTFSENVLRRVAGAQRNAVPDGWAGARGRLVAASWLLIGAASIAVLTRLEWSSASRTAAWGLALALVPLAYSATLWPDRFLGLLALCGGPLLGTPREGPQDPPAARTR
jgi:hypothetical protein